MYKFTNGVVVYDDATRDKYIKAGMVLVKEETKKMPEEEEIDNVKQETQSRVEPNKFEKTGKRTGRFGRNFK